MSASCLPYPGFAGYLVLENFTPAEQLAEMRQQAVTLVDEFDPETISVFSTKNQVCITQTKHSCMHIYQAHLHICARPCTYILLCDIQTKTSNDYFSESANNISFFFEENAFDDDGQLRQPKALSINKMGHGSVQSLLSTLSWTSFDQNLLLHSI